ncbi:MAG: winged helix-turn-helix domain-containing protein [Terriglobales bacterium]|jgi:DNA-binding winged helix-turn-helix (wHTH) protein/tetratricopeptide (TPR) repeat protein
MSSSDFCVYEFEGFRIEADKRLLSHAGSPVSLTPKVFDTLLYLIEHKGEVLETEALMRALWPDTIVEENNLNQNISTLRRVLGEKRGENRYIVTVPGKGYRFIAQVAVSGARSEAASKEPTQVTLAVLPFENLGAGPEREYLADGLTEETIAALGQADPSHFSVIGRTSVMRYKRTTKTLAEIGGELGTAYLVESSLRGEGGRLRITSKLIRVRDQVQMWSASYDSEPSSMLVFQRELSTAIAEQIRMRLSPEQLTALGRRQTRNAEAYDLYLHGRHYWNQLTPPTTRIAVDYYTRATRLDPNYALAWSGLADAFSSSPVNGDAQPLAVLPRAREAAEHAVRAEPDLAEVQSCVAFLDFWLEWDWPAAEKAARKAIALDPSYPLAHRFLGIVLSHSGVHAEAQLAMRRARELDPFYPMQHALSAQAAFAGRDYPAAVQFARQSVVVDPEFWIGHLQLAQVYIELGKTELALDALNIAGKLSANSKVTALRGYLFARTDRTNEAMEVLKTLEAISRERYLPPYAIALVHAGLGQHDLAVQWLERAYEARDVHLAFVPVDPKWDSFRNDPRFAALLNRCDFNRSGTSRANESRQPAENLA